MRFIVINFFIKCIFIISSFISLSFAQVKFEEPIGKLSTPPSCRFVLDKAGIVKCYSSVGFETRKLKPGSFDLLKSIISSVGADGSRYELVFGLEGADYKLGYLWDKELKRPVVYNGGAWSYEKPQAYKAHPFHSKSFVKPHFEVRYFFVKSEVKPRLRKYDSTKQVGFAIDRNVVLMDKPNGKQVLVVKGKAVASYRIDFSHASDADLKSRARDLYLIMNARVVESKRVKGELWYYVKIPVNETETEIDSKYFEGRGTFHVDITFKQSIFNEEKVGWIKVFDDDGFFVFR